MKKEYTNVNTNKLHDELVSNGIIPDSVENKDNKTWITFKPETDLNLVQQIIDAHNPLETVKEAKIKELNEACNHTILGHFKTTIDEIEYEFSYDFEAQSRFNGIGVLFFANKINEITWTAYQNGERVRIVLNQSNFDIVSLAALQHQDYNIAKFNQLLQQVNSATTKEAVEEIVWDE